ncbi:tetratricopeptide repeat protein [Endozoicomonas sp.]|uniref:tetratricopeptide repeat protein n=1 Tax=Endozoicomonas sp. TaxID=1892382 RepID=UPI003AF5F98D
MIDDKLLKSLADIGFMASGTGLPKHAFGIFNGIEAARPDSPLSTIGFALEFMNRKRHQEAIDILHKEGLSKHPEDPTIKAFLGLALMFAGRNKESEDYLKPLLSSKESEPSIMAKELLANIHGK